MSGGQRKCAQSSLKSTGRHVSPFQRLMRSCTRNQLAATDFLQDRHDTKTWCSSRELYWRETKRSQIMRHRNSVTESAHYTTYSTVLLSFTQTQCYTPTGCTHAIEPVRWWSERFLLLDGCNLENVESPIRGDGGTRSRWKKKSKRSI